jgi:hypothetical protein
MTISCNHENKKPVDVIGIEIMLCDECAKKIKDKKSN